MSSSLFQLSEYKSYHLNKHSITPSITQYIENCAVNEVIGASHSFHKIIVNGWSDENEELFNTLSDYFDSMVIPVNAINKASVVSFYTSNLNLVLKIMKLDFMMPYARNMFNISIIFNEKTSKNLFGRQVTLEDIVSHVVNRRFSENHELDLSYFRNDEEFKEHKIHFYKISLLSSFKILMLRMGKETKSLNLSQNRLSKVPLEVLNFFIRGDLTSINLSYNTIQSLSDLSRVSSKIEKLWIEGNPLCDDIEPSKYVKNVVSKFPRLIELDGFKLNEHGMVPMIRNYLVTPDRCTKLVVERFLIMFFTLYDDQKLYKRTTQLYDDNATFTIMSDLTDAQERLLKQQPNSNSRNILDPNKRVYTETNQRMYKTKADISGVLATMAKTLHDPHTFTIDVLLHNQQSLVIVVDGILKVLPTSTKAEVHFKFRRTFVLAIYPEAEDSRIYTIMNDMLYVGLATKDQTMNSFKRPIINHNSLALVNPNQSDIDTLLEVFMNVTKLKKSAAQLRLKINNWDINEATKEFIKELGLHKISKDSFIEEEEDFSDVSSLLDFVD